MTDKAPPVHAELDNHVYAGYLDEVLAGSLGISQAGLVNLDTGECLLRSAGEAADGSAGAGLAEKQWCSLAGCYFSEESAEFRLAGELTEIMVRQPGWVLAACRASGSTRILAAVLPGNTDVRSTVSKLQHLAVTEGDEPDDDGVGAAVVLNGDHIGRVGKLPSAMQQLADDGSVRKLLTQIFDGDSGCLPAQYRGELEEVQLVSAGVRYVLRRIPFAPDHVVGLTAVDGAGPDELSDQAETVAYDVLRGIIDQLLASDEFVVPDTSLPKDDQAFMQIIQELRALPRNDLPSLLKVGGFANHKLGEEGEMEDGAMVLRCKECIYYLPNRRWCDLPELPVPVEPEWYCRLWKL